MSNSTQPQEVDVEDLKFRNSVLESMMHRLHMYRCITLDTDSIKEILNAIDAWSYAHEGSNGEQSDIERQNNIESKFNKIAELVL